MLRLCFKRLSVGTFLAVLAVGWACLPAQGGEAPKSIADLLKEAEQGLQKAQAETKEQLNKADQLYEEGKYSEAKKFYEQAKNKATAAGVELQYEDSRRLEKRLSKLNKQVAEAANNAAKDKFDVAVTLYQSGEYEKAKTLFSEVQASGADIGFFKKRELNRYLARIDEDIQAAIQKRDQEQREALAKRKELKQRLADGEALLAKGQYDDALDALQEVAVADDVLDAETLAKANSLIETAKADRQAAAEAHKLRRSELKQQYAEAVALLQAQQYREAKAAFDKVQALLDQDRQLDAPKGFEKKVTETLAALQAQEEERRQVAKKRQEFETRLGEAQAAVASARYDEAINMLAKLNTDIKASGIELPADKQKEMRALFARADVGRQAAQQAKIQKELAKAARLREEATKKLTEEQQAERMLQKALRNQQIAQQLKKAEAEHHFKTAQRLFNETKFKEAETELTQAVAADPNYEQAKDLLAKVQRIVSGQPPGIDDFAEATARALRVRIEKAKLDMNNFVAKGQQAIAEKRYDDAIESFKNAMSVISYLEKQTDVTADREKIEALLASAKDRKAEADRVAETAKAKKAREEMAHMVAKDEERFRNKKVELFTRGWRLIREERYDEAEKVAKMIREIDPEDQSARLLLEQAHRKRHSQGLRDKLERKQREKDRGIEDLIERSTPYSDIVNYVDRETWQKEIASRKPVVSYVSRSETSEADKKIQESLQKPVTLDFADTPVRDVITFLQDFTGVNMVLDPNAVEDGGNAITLKVQDMPFEKALSYILKFAQLEYQIRDGALFISNKEGLSEYALHTYDVRDLLIHIQDQTIQNVNIGGGGGGGLSGLGGGGGANQEDQLDLNDRATDLLTLITKIIEPQSWAYVFVSGGGQDSDTDIELDDTSEDAQGGIVYREGDMMVWQIPSVHEKIGQLLDGMRQTRNMQVSVEARFITMTDNFEERIGITINNFTMIPNPELANPANPNSPLSHELFLGGPSTGYVFPNITGNTLLHQNVQNTPGSAPFIGSNQAEGNTGMNLRFSYVDNIFLQGFLRAVQESDEAENLTCPRLTLTNTQRGNVINATEITYIPSFTASSNIAVPTVSSVWDGVVFDVRPIVSADRRYVFLELTPSLTSVTMNEFNFNQSQGTGTLQTIVTTTLQQPSVDTQSVAVTVCVPDRGTVMIGGLSARSRTRQVSGVPVLSKLPIIKRLFQDDAIVNDKRNVLLLVRPEIIVQEEQEAKL